MSVGMYHHAASKINDHRLGIVIHVSTVCLRQLIINKNDKNFNYHSVQYHLTSYTLVPVSQRRKPHPSPSRPRVAWWDDSPHLYGFGKRRDVGKKSDGSRYPSSPSPQRSAWTSPCNICFCMVALQTKLTQCKQPYTLWCLISNKNVYTSNSHDTTVYTFTW